MFGAVAVFASPSADVFVSSTSDVVALATCAYSLLLVSAAILVVEISRRAEVMVSYS